MRFVGSVILGFLAATVLVGLMGSAGFASSPNAMAGIAGLHVLVWALVSWWTYRSASTSASYRQLMNEVGDDVPAHFVRLIGRFEAGIVLTRREIDAMVAYFEANEKALQALRQQRPGVASAIEQFFGPAQAHKDAETDA